MASFEELVKRQGIVGDKIENIVRNYKKDPLARKSTVSYFEERLKRLDDEWTIFEANDNEIRLLKNLPLEHDYFTKEYYDAIRDIVQQYKEIFEKSMLKVTQTVDQAKGEQSHTSGANAAPTEVSGITKLIRRQRTMMASLERLLNENFTEEDVPTATTLWQHIEDIHFEICEMCDEPTDQGYNLDRFITLETNMRSTVKKFTGKPLVQQPPEGVQYTTETIPLSKVTIPKFDGNYLKWQEFHDLFLSLVVNQPLTKVQKIWYLKTHLTGEAANLIKHFAATEKNFDDAWAIVVDRYNNKRLLVSRLIHELIDGHNDKAGDNFKGLHDKTQECLLALQNLKVDTSSWDPLLLHLLLKRLDHTTRLRFEQSLSQPREVPTIEDFLKFLERNFQSMEAMGTREKRSSPKVYTSVVTENQACTMCKNGKHPLFACKTFLQSSPTARVEFVQKQNLCFNCLKPGHNVKNCISRSCVKCNKKHNTLLHVEQSSQHRQNLSSKINSVSNRTTAGSQLPTTQDSQEAASLTAAQHSSVNSYILLSTAMVIVKAKGKEVSCRAILDSGSQLNFVSERLVKRLGISLKPASICISGIGSSNTKVRHRVNVTLQSQINNFTTRLEAAVLPHIVLSQPAQEINIEKWPIPKNIKLADPQFNRPDKIDVLLGAEFYHQLLAIGQIKLANDLPTLQNTVLGWVIAGRIGKTHLSTATCGMCTENEINLEEAIAKLWEMENITTNSKSLSVSEKLCENHFASNYTIDQNGKFVVRLPFCKNPEELGESHGVAYNRFIALERRLASTPEIKMQYIRFMEEYETLGHMTKIDINSLLKPNYFIPHHCILKPESLTTKLRVVFDASAKSSSGLSLNDAMYAGPTVQSELFSIILRFRLPRFVFTTDVEKMYRQILMHPEDRKFQIIIWRKNPTEAIKYYQLNTVTYGTRAAPYLATKCLEKIAQENLARYPLGAHFLLNNFYVDDGLGGADSLRTALTIQEELKTILKQHGLNLQKWSANHPQLLQNVSTKEEVNIDFSENNQTVKTLGLTWIPKLDKFCVKVCLGDIKRVTKRTVSSDLARLFDPLGIVAPIIVTAKIFIQELWKLKLTWDEALPAELHTKWTTFRDELKHIDNMKFSRHVFDGHVISVTQIHTFVDASEKAYGAAVYIRSIQKNGQILVRLLCSKSRVAPLKRQSLPRLELCAALLGAQLTARVKGDLKLEDATTFLWTDSQIVLAWINSQSSSYQTFVANRIAAIQELSLAEQWRHVSSKDNPADIISRGLPAKRLSSCNLWFYGPIFLHGQETVWPQKYSKALEIVDNNIERKRVTAIATSENPITNIVYNINHKGSFRTLQRIVAYILRFINNTRKLKTSPDLALTVTELEQALVVIVRTMQSEFVDDLKHLNKKNEVSKGSSFSNLSPFLDSNGIIRVGGRLDSSLLSYDAKHPMILPYNDPIAKLIMQMVHEQNKHCGPQALLSHIRQRYWPVKGKSAARAIVQRCVRCTKARPKLLHQIMGNLPTARVTPARPFINAGVDFCGPFWVHYKVRGKKPQKAYIAVFCCFATKAVHLELVSDLTTEAFMGSLKRFISRRGHCQNLYCDNATNFVGAKNQLSELSETIYSSSAQEIIHRECISRGITFHFIPPRAPHFGGLWEAAVKSAKHLLTRSVSTSALTYEELETVVIEIEGILNSRPISPMSENPNDLAALTPGHFLIGEPLTAQVDTHATPNKTNLLTRWKLIAHLKNEFWKRWSREYLNELQYRHKWKAETVNIKPGDMVIIKEDNTAPLQWPLGRVEKIHQGEDGLARVVDVKTAQGNYRRPITRLALLPIIAEHSNETIDQHQPTNSNINQNSDKHEIPMKRMRTSINLLTAVMCFMLLPLVLGSSIHNKPFGTQPGIYYEGIGTTLITPTEWQLLVYYDLEGFWSELTLFSNGTRALDHLCQELQQRATCINLVNYFKHTESRLIMDSTLLSGKRQKRAAMDIVGNIAHSLFGVLDSEYAENMAHTITQVKQNDAHLLSLLKNQTSIIDSTINIIKLDQEAAKKKFDQIDTQISQIYNRVRNNSEQERTYHIFSSLCVQLTIMAANLDQTQSLLLDILTNTHHGIISPLLLTPIQLQREVDKILFHMPDSLQLPVKREDALQLYKLMKVTGGLTNTTATFSVTLPLIERDRYDLFNLVPIPRWINNTLVSMEICSSLLAINVMQDRYFLMNNAELDSCIPIKGETYLCSKGQIRYELDAAACACEISLFFNKTQSDCNLHRLKTKSAWISLRHQNQWIYSIPSPSHATAVCKKNITQLILKGSGLLSLGPECVLQHNSTTIQAHHKISSSTTTSYSRFWEITDEIHTKTVEPLLIEINKSKYVSQIQNLTALQTSLTEQKILQLPNQIETQYYHHITISYSALIITVGIMVYLITKRKFTFAPTPAPRNLQPSSVFTVHI